MFLISSQLITFPVFFFFFLTWAVKKRKGRYRLFAIHFQYTPMGNVVFDEIGNILFLTPSSRRKIRLTRKSTGSQMKIIEGRNIFDGIHQYQFVENIKHSEMQWTWKMPRFVRQKAKQLISIANDLNRLTTLYVGICSERGIWLNMHRF